MNQQPTILITGATGANGSELLKLFAARSIPVRALTRSAKRAQAIASPSTEIVEGDFSDPNSLRAALKGIERAFLLSPSTEDAQQQQIAFVQAARSSGAHIVKLSQLDADAHSPARFLRYHAAVEASLRASGLAFTFLRPNLFMQGMLAFKSTILAQGAFYAAAGEGQISVIDVRDIARVAFAALTEPGHEGKIYDLTGPQPLTHAEMAAQLATALEKPVEFVDVAPDAMRQGLVGAGFPQWQADGLIEEYAGWSRNHAASVASDVETVTRQAPNSFAQFARDYAPAFKATDENQARA